MLVQVDHELVMVGCDYYTTPGTNQTMPVYIVKNQWGHRPQWCACPTSDLPEWLVCSFALRELTRARH